MNTNAILTGLAVTLAGGCQVQELPIGGGRDPLEVDDVDSVPPGIGQAPDVAGAYIFSSFDVEQCRCREGDAVASVCAPVWEIGADGLWLQQHDGALTMTPIGAEALQSPFELSGGVFDDGSYEVGATYDVRDGNATIGQAYHLARGMIDPQRSMTADWTIRVQFVSGPSSFDCDIEARFELLYWAPEAMTQCDLDAECHPTTPHCVQGICGAGENGDACRFDNDCSSQACVDDVCRSAELGEPCSFPSDCQSEACGTEGVCVDPDTGGCGDLSPCADGRICVESKCQDGVEGDPCQGPLHCVVGFNCVEGSCWDGSEGDPCERATDCDLSIPLQCLDDGICGTE